MPFDNPQNHVVEVAHTRGGEPPLGSAVGNKNVAFGTELCHSVPVPFHALPQGDNFVQQSLVFLDNNHEWIVMYGVD